MSQDEKVMDRIENLKKEIVKYKTYFIENKENLRMYYDMIGK